MLKNSCKLALIFFVFLIINSCAFAQEEAPKEQSNKEQSDWLHNQSNNFWIKKPLGWDRADKGLTGDLNEELVSPKRDAFIEVYAAKLAGYMTPEIMANSWEVSMKEKLKYLQKRISSEQIKVEGASGILRVYQSNRKEDVLKTYTLYVYQNGKTFVVVGIFPEKLAADYEAAVKEAVLSFRLVSP